MQGRMFATLLINCGYARVIIKETATDTSETSELTFKRQFQVCSHYGVSDDLFTRRGKNKSKFEYARQIISKGFTQKWHPTEAKQTYITQFSSGKWKALAKNKNTD